MAPQDTANATAQEQGKGWFTPVRLLCLFCAMNMLVYLDRGACSPPPAHLHARRFEVHRWARIITVLHQRAGVISSNGVNGGPATQTQAAHGIQGDFGLSLTQDGYLPAAFLVGMPTNPCSLQAMRPSHAVP